MTLKGVNMYKILGRLAILSIAILFGFTACVSGGSSSATPALVSSPTVEGPAPSQAQQSTAVPSQAASSSSAGNLVFTVLPNQSQVDYRVREQLVRLSLPSDAVGKTNAVTGTIMIQPDGTMVPSQSKLVVDVSSLASDENMRDNFVRRNILQTSQYPQVTFVPTQASDLSTPLPQSGDFTFKLTGDLTIREVTKPVTWNVTGQIQGGQITAQASTTFTFEDFNLTQPKVPVVLSVEDHITLEANLVMQQANQ